MSKFSFGSATVFAVMITGTAAQSIQIPPPPICEGGDATTYYDAENLTGGLTLASGSDRDGYAVLLASCSSLRQMRVEGIEQFEQRTSVYNELIGFVASADTYTFNGLAARYNAGPFTASVLPIAEELCTCLSERM